ncbi:MAG: TonB-dependent receptor [Moraxellaceae bacterium]|nr:TonB-dependent receptor [Moraxellaceae bacterium]
MLYRHLLAGLVCFFHVPLVMAETQGPTLFAEDDAAPVVLSATRLRQSLLDAPAAVTIIDRQMIEQSGVREIPEILRLVPGMVVGYESGSEAFVSYHGTAADQARRMQVLIDGRSIYQPLLASVDWVGLPLELADIERIEVIRGPNAASYGVNSFLAVVNIITRHPADVERGRITYRRGEDGIEDYFARLAQRSGAVDWRLSVAGRRDDGFEENRRLNNSDFTDSKNVDSVYSRMVWSPLAGTSLDFSFGESGMEAQQQYRPTFFTKPPVADRENRFASLAWEQEVGASHRFRLLAAHSRFDRDEPWYVTLPPLVFRNELGLIYQQNRQCALWAISNRTEPSSCTAADVPLLMALETSIASDPGIAMAKNFVTDNTVHESRTEVELQHTWVVSPDFRTVFGASYDDAKARSNTYLDGRAENEVVGLFAHAEWRLFSSFLVNAGGGYENDKGAGEYFSPRLALNWSFADNQVLRAIFSKAVRTPDILETSADWRYRVRAINPADAIYAQAPHGTFFQTGLSQGNAPTEKIRASELGYHLQLDNRHLSIDVKLFSDEMWLAAPDLEIELFTIRPAIPFRQDGAELAIDWRPLPSQRFQMSYTYMDMDGRFPDDNTAFVPQHSGSFAWWQSYGSGWQLGTSYVFYNDLRVQQFFFDRLDVRLAKKIPLGGRQVVELSASMQWRLTDDPELRMENGSDRHRGWLGVDWRY